MQAQPNTVEVSPAEIIARQNDAFRKTLMPVQFEGQMLRGRISMTIGVANLHHETLISVLETVRNFTEFEEGDDPYGQRDFVAFSHAVCGHYVRFFFKIDYYSDSAMNYASEDPSDPSQTYRVATLMLASEY